MSRGHAEEVDDRGGTDGDGEDEQDPREIGGGEGEESEEGHVDERSAEPKRSIQKKSALRPRKVPSSRRRQYRLRKNMWKTKSMPRLPKKKKLVKRRHSWPFLKMRCEL